MKLSKKSLTDVIIGLVVLAMGIVGYFASAYIRDTAGSVSASTVPRLCSVILGLLGIMLAATAAAEGRSAGAGKEEAATPADYRKFMSFALLLITFIAYALLLKVLGFLLSTVLFLVALMFLLSPGDSRRPVLFTAVSIAATAGIYCIFVVGFQVMLPAGILGLG